MQKIKKYFFIIFFLFSNNIFSNNSNFFIIDKELHKDINVLDENQLLQNIESILIKLTANNKIMDDPKIKPLLQNIKSTLVKYENIGENTWRLYFNSQYIIEYLSKNAVKYLSLNRPSILIWLNISKELLLSDKELKDLYVYMQEYASLYSLQVIEPLWSDLYFIGKINIENDFNDLLKMNQKYNADNSILVDLEYSPFDEVGYINLYGYNGFNVIKWPDCAVKLQMIAKRIIDSSWNKMLGNVDVNTAIKITFLNFKNKRKLEELESILSNSIRVIGYKLSKVTSNSVEYELVVTNVEYFRKLMENDNTLKWKYTVDDAMQHFYYEVI